MDMLVGKNVSRAQFEFYSIDTLFSKKNLSWNIVKGFGLYNTSTNIGAKNLIKQRAIEKNENICYPCHILHNTSSVVNLEFSKISKLDVEDDTYVSTISLCFGLYIEN